MTRRGNEPIPNAVSFDLEHWHSATLLRDEVTDPVDRIEESVDIVLDLLREHDVRATFFVVGAVAAEYPSLIRKIHDEGHEIGSHGQTHTPLFELTPDAFADELSQSADAIERAIGAEPSGFRAPNFSITRETDWAFDVLESSDYRYDSSVFPVKTPMYGVSGAPLGPYRVSTVDRFRASPSGTSGDGLVEFPLSVVDLGVRLPIAGGFYSRVLPTAVLKRGVRWLNRRDIPANLYFHPWEFNPDVPVDDPPVHKRFVSFHGIDALPGKLSSLLAEFDFGTVRSALGDRTDFETRPPESRSGDGTTTRSRG